ncbi:TPA: hypothetical protein QFG12_002375, partial [Enterococcus faecium]
KNKEAFANEVLSKYPELATNDSFLNELTDKTTNEAYKVLKKWTKKSIEHKEVTHDEADKVPMDVADYSFLSGFSDDYMKATRMGKDTEEMFNRLDRTLNKYGISGYQPDIVTGSVNLNTIAYVKK